MSGAPPKRLHEDSGHSTPTKRPLEDSNTFSSLSGKPVQPSGNDFHLLYESSQDVRLAKVPRIEHRDNDKRSSLLHRMPASSNNSSLDHSISPEIRSEFRNSKDARDVKNENREIKPEIRELNTDAKVDPQGSRGENDVRIDGRGDEKQSRSDKGSHGAYRGDVKFEKDNCVVPNPHLNWKETKEPHKGKRYLEAPNDGLDSWRAARHAIQQTDEVMRDSSTVEERDSVEAHEAVGENRVELKEEKFREKDRKRKDDKHRDVGERDKDKSDRRNTLPLVSPNNERKDPLREERELERWERDKRDPHRDKQRNERERDPIKMELNANEKECLHNDKEWVDESIKISEQENTTIEPTGPTDDSWKVCDRDSKERKNERDVDLGDRFEHHGRCNDKELDDASTEGDGVTEKDREVFGSSVQHRRRMSRSRGTSQAAHREPRFRSRARDNEGSQGQSDISAVVYKAGECMQELLRSWKELEASQDSKNDQIFQSYPTLEIRIPAEYVTATNHQVRGGQLWGTDLYTDDSDLVAVLMHTGYCRPTSSPPPSAIQELRATVRVLPPQDCYTSTLRNNVRSRAWGAGIGCSYRVERCCIVKKGGGTIDLEPHVNHISAVEPTLAPVFVERTMTTRAAASNALRQQRFVREVTIQYNLCNEPWLKYSISVVADKGLKKPLYTSARLKKGEVLYLETHFNRYELCFTGEKTVCNGTASTYSQAPESEQEKLQNHSSHVLAGDKNLTDRENIIDIFRWSRCKKALPQNVMRSIGIPLTLEHIEVLDENLAWEDVQWSQTGVWVSGKEYALARVHFLSRS